MSSFSLQLAHLRPLVLMASLLAVSCAADTEDGARETSIANDANQTHEGGGEMPSIYVDQRVEVFDHKGTNSSLRSYRALLKTCQQQSLHPTHPLSDEEVQKIGTTRVQRWIKADKAAYRIEAFDFGTAGDSLCGFRLYSDGAHVYFDREHTVAIDLGTNNKTVAEPVSWLLERSQSLSLDDALAKELGKLETYAVDGPPTRQTVAGAPCLGWSTSNVGGTHCVWSGGTKWGFHISPGVLLLHNKTDLLYHILLKQEPGQGNPQKLTTQKFVVGSDFDAGAMLPRPSTAMAKSGGGGKP